MNSTFEALRKIASVYTGKPLEHFIIRPLLPVDIGRDDWWWRLKTNPCTVGTEKYILIIGMWPHPDDTSLQPISYSVEIERWNGDRVGLLVPGQLLTDMMPSFRQNDMFRVVINSHGHLLRPVHFHLLGWVAEPNGMTLIRE